MASEHTETLDNLRTVVTRMEDRCAMEVLRVCLHAAEKIAGECEVMIAYEPHGWAVVTEAEADEFVEVLRLVEHSAAEGFFSRIVDNAVAYLDALRETDDWSVEAMMRSGKVSARVVMLEAFRYCPAHSSPDVEVTDEAPCEECGDLNAHDPARWESAWCADAGELCDVLREAGPRAWRDDIARQIAERSR
jgi:hypothetical protein